MRFQSLLMVCSALVWVSCSDSTVRIDRPSLPAPKSPESHVKAPKPLNIQATRPPLPKINPESIARYRPAPAPQSEESNPLSAVPTTPKAEITPTEKPSEVEAKQKDDTQDALEEWLGEANAIQPGCLLEGQRPDLALPSPKVLSLLLREQPTAFAGVAREALVCLLGLPKVANAEVFGKTAFRSQALATQLSMDGGKRKQGVIVALITTSEPRGVGTYVGVMDERNDVWSMRHALFMPWRFDYRGHQLHGVRGVRTVSRRRHTLVITQGNASQKFEQHVGLTSTDELKVLAQIQTKGTNEDGTKAQGRVYVRGKTWPRDLVLRNTLTDNSGAKTWELVRWRASGENAYSGDKSLSGPISLDGAQDLLEAGFASDADWVITRLPKSIRRTSAAHLLRADCDMARGKNRHALRDWKRALRARDASPTLQRDYGLFLVKLKRKKAAVKALQRYLKRNPDAEDAANITDILDSLAGRK